MSDDAKPAADGAELAELRREVEELRAELAKRDEQRRQAGRLAMAGGSFAARIVAGRGLTQAVRRWFKAKTLTDPLPAEETADLAAAIFRRAIRVGVIGLIVAALPTILLIWQNYLIRSQNDLLQNQLEQQAADTLIVRRAQLLATIYTTECTDPEDPETCLPKANPRAVREAVLAFVEIERGRGETSDLRWANLREVNLSYADLSEANLFEANLRDALLFEADLHDAFLFGADLRGVGLNEANLSEANLFRADLSGAILEEADLSRVNLHEANLQGAILRGTQFLTPEQLAEACGDETTRLPEGFEKPDGWPCRFERDASGERVRFTVQPESPQKGGRREVPPHE